MRYNPYTKGRAIAKLTEVLRLAFRSENEFQNNFAEWESIFEESANESQKRVPDSLKSTVLAESAPKAVSEHIRLKADKRIKQCALDCVVSKNTGPTPMEVGVLTKGKDKGKGTGGKGERGRYGGNNKGKRPGKSGQKKKQQGILARQGSPCNLDQVMYSMRTATTAGCTVTSRKTAGSMEKGQLPSIAKCHNRVRAKTSTRAQVRKQPRTRATVKQPHHAVFRKIKRRDKSII